MKLRTGNKLYSVSLLLLSLAFLHTCHLPAKKKAGMEYHFQKPDSKYVLQRRLSEVSGLTFISENDVALIEDEDGSVFFYNLQDQKISRRIRFAKDGDFEDLKAVGDTLYMLRSDGKIYEIKNFRESGKTPEVNRYETGLSGKNNTEGLCYDPAGNRLLIACKGHPAESKEDTLKNKKAVYSFDLVTKERSAKPVYVISENEVEKMAYGTSRNVLEKYIRFYRRNNKALFEPSGIAIHPLTHEIYVISSVGKMLVILSPDGKLKGAVHLPGNVFRQPEGIAFDQQANLYISNEGRKGKGNILRFNYTTQPQPLIQ